MEHHFGLCGVEPFVDMITANLETINNNMISGLEAQTEFRSRTEVWLERLTASANMCDRSVVRTHELRSSSSQHV